VLTAVGCALLAGPAPVCAADVTYERLLNPEPQNWLMNHHDFNAQRYSALDAINKSNVKGMRLLFAIALGGTSGNEALEGTPLVEDGFMYISDHWGVVYKIDVRDGKAGRIVWKMDPAQEKLDRNRGVALWNNLVISVASIDARVVATDKETGKIVWEKNLRDHPDMFITAAPLALKDSIIIGASGGDRGTRNWVASLDAKTGNVLWKTYSIPGPGEPGHETWKDKNNAWQTGGGAFYVTGSYDPAYNLTYWGSGNPVPGYDAQYRPGDNLYTSSAIAFDAATGKISWWHQYTPNDNRDYDETGTHILIDTKVNGDDRKLVSHAGRNGFNYTFDRGNGQFLKAAQYVKEVTWTKGIDPKSGKPVDYDPGKQVYAEGNDVNADKRARRVCPDTAGGNNYWPATYSQKTKLVYIPGNEGRATVTPDYRSHVKGNFAGGTTTDAGRISSSIVAVDPATSEVKMRRDLPYPNFAGALDRGRHRGHRAPRWDGLAFDDRRWKSSEVQRRHRLQRAPMTYAVDGKQYIAIARRVPQCQEQVSRAPEMRNLANSTMIFVFGM
jgi:alcohol dehydrogenase (cytochrome c)